MVKNALRVAAVAWVGLAASGVMAQEGQVSIYGRFQESIEFVSANKSARGAQINLYRVSSDGSIFGIRGSEDLGQGWKAIFTLQSTVLLDVSGSTLGSHQSGVGLQSPYGTMILGQWDTPYKSSTASFDPFFEAPPFSQINILAGNTATTNNNVANRQAFNRRARNSVWYETPEWSGFRLQGLVAANEERDTCGAIRCDPWLWSTAALYNNGPLYLAGAIEGHEEYANTATVQSHDRGYKLGVGYNIGGTHNLNLQLERLEWHNNIAAIGLPKFYSATGKTDVTLDTWAVGYTDTTFSPHVIRAMVGQNRPLKVGGSTAPETRADYVSLAYVYLLSKRTEVWAAYIRTHNQENSRNDIVTNPIGVNFGQSPNVIGIGTRMFW